MGISIVAQSGIDSGVAGGTSELASGGASLHIVVVGAGIADAASIYNPFGVAGTCCALIGIGSSASAAVRVALKHSKECTMDSPIVIETACIRNWIDIRIYCDCIDVISYWSKQYLSLYSHKVVISIGAAFLLAYGSIVIIGVND